MTDKIVGLSDDEVARRTERGLTNEQPKNSSKTVSKILFDNVFTYFNFVHIFLCFLVLFVREYRNALFVLIILTNTVIGIVQEIRAKKTVDRLSSLTATKVKTVRNGTEKTVFADSLVLGDTVRLSRGDVICADARVLSGTVDVNESLQTGEPDDIRKNEGDTLISGSYVTSGNAYAVLERVGRESFAYKLTTDAKRIRPKKSEILKSLNSVVKVMGIVIIPVGILLFLQQMNHGVSFTESVVGTVASVVGMIPSGLYLLTSIALTVSVIHLAEKRTLVRQMYSVEALARTDVLCLDKTGTLTTGEMELLKTETVSDFSPEKLSAFLFSLDSHDPTSEALKRAYGHLSDEKATELVAFDSARKWSACLLSDGWYVLGAFDRLLQKSEVSVLAERYASEGNRVLAFGKAEAISDGRVLGFRPAALFIVGEKIRNGAAETVAFFQDNSVEICVISGDYAQTVSAVAVACGVKNADRAINLSDIHDDMIPELVETYRVFGRVTPRQKKLIVRALQKNGHTVTMTGDGVNDVLALKEADCGVSMSAGADMAREVGEVVLLDNDWTALKDVVAEGRRVIHNIERSGSLFFVKTMYSLVLSLLVLVLPQSYPFESIQMSLISVVTVGIPGFLLALERNGQPVRGGFLRRMLTLAFPSAVAVIASVVLILVMNMNGVFSATQEQVSTCASLVTLCIGYTTLFMCCLPLNKYRTAVLAICLFLGVLGVAFFPWFFSLCALSLRQILVTALLSAASACIIALSRILLKKMRIF